MHPRPGGSGNRVDSNFAIDYHNLWTYIIILICLGLVSALKALC